MKRLLFIFLLLTPYICNLSYASEDKEVSIGDIPSKVEHFMHVYFEGSKIKRVTKRIETNLYKVVTTDSITLYFEKSGKWRAVDCNTETVPSLLIPREILQQVAKIYGPTAKIVIIDRHKKGYHIKLSNGIVLGFTKRFKLIPVEQ